MAEDITEFLNKVRNTQLERQNASAAKMPARAVDKHGNNIKLVESIKRPEMKTNAPQASATARPIRRLSETVERTSTPIVSQITQRPRNYKNAPPALLDLFDQLIDFVEYNGTRVIGQLASFLEKFEQSPGISESVGFKPIAVNSAMTGPMQKIAVPGMGEFTVQGTEDQRKQKLFEQLKDITGSSSPATQINFAEAPPPLELPEIDMSSFQQPGAPS